MIGCGACGLDHGVSHPVALSGAQGRPGAPTSCGVGVLTRGRRGDRRPLSSRPLTAANVWSPKFLGGDENHIATSDPWPLHMLHDRLTRPEAQLTTRRNELRTSLRSFQCDTPLVAALRHARLPEERHRYLDIADELAMGEGIGDEIARGRLLHQVCYTICRRHQRHRVVEHRWAATQLL